MNEMEKSNKRKLIEKEAEMQREEELKALKQKQKTAFSLLRR